MLYTDTISVFNNNLERATSDCYGKLNDLKKVYKSFRK